MPNAPPTCREALITPEAMPARVRSTAAMPVDETAGIVSAMPAPIRIWNGQIALNDEDTSSRESPSSPIDAISMPAVISVRGPTRAFSRPPIGATIRIIMVIGSARTPACCGVVALDVLEVEREVVDDAEEADADEGDHHARGAERAPLEEAQRDHRIGVAALPLEEAGHQREPDADERQACMPTPTSARWS